MTDFGIAAERLRSLVERIERLEDQKRDLQATIKPLMKDIADAIKDVMAEARSAGFDTAALRVILAERRPMRRAEDEVADLVALYRRALGQLAGTPLGDASAIGRAERALADAH